MLSDRFCVVDSYSASISINNDPSCSLGLHPVRFSASPNLRTPIDGRRECARKSRTCDGLDAHPASELTSCRLICHVYSIPSPTKSPLHNLRRHRGDAPKRWLICTPRTTSRTLRLALHAFAVQRILIR